MTSSHPPKHIEPEQIRQGATLKAFRQLRGLKVGELAKQLDISSAYLSNIEAGRKRLTPIMLAKAATALGIRQVALVHPASFFKDAA